MDTTVAGIVHEFRLLLGTAIVVASGNIGLMFAIRRRNQTHSSPRSSALDPVVMVLAGMAYMVPMLALMATATAPTDRRLLNASFHFVGFGLLVPVVALIVALFAKGALRIAGVFAAMAATVLCVAYLYYAPWLAAALSQSISF